jgi:hypothetical protein
MLTGTLAALAALLPAAHACAFAGSGAPLPPGHPSPLLGITAPGVPYMDAAGEASVFPHLQYNDWQVPRALANLSTHYGTPLCYLSQQVLPSPPTGFSPATGACTPSPCAWPALPASPSDVAALLALGSQALSRMRAMAAGSPAFQGSTCAMGAGNLAVFCATAPPATPACSAGARAQATRWAVASNLLRVTADTLPALIANVTDWRGSQAWHAPAMGSDLVAARGWGFGGAISFKAMPCADVPAALLGNTFDCQALDPASGKTVWEEAFAWWSEYKAPQWLREEVGALQRALQAAAAER